MRRFILILALCAAFFCQCALAEAPEQQNLLMNGGFEELEDGWPVGWQMDMWLYEPGVSYLEVREDGYEGGLCAMIENVASNDARFVQTVSVQPGTTYHLSGWVKAEGCNPDYAGASLSIIGTYATFPEVHDTEGEWVFLECWIRTADTHTSLRIGPRLGDYSADNTGKAYFDDLSLTLAEELEPEALIIPLMDTTGYVQQSSEPEPAATSGSGNMIAMVIAFAVALCALWILRARGVALPQAAIVLVLLLAALVRLYLMATEPGYQTDMGCFYAWSLRMAEVGPAGFYADGYFCDYPPGYMYLLWLTGMAMRLLGVENLGMSGRVVVKFVPMLADLGAILLLWQLARKRLGNTPAVLLAALYAVSPAILVDGAVWGQVDAVLALGLLGTLTLAMRHNWKAALPVFVVTVLMKPQALMVAPIGVAALVLDIVPWKNGGKKVAIDAAIGLGIALAGAVVMLLPFLWGTPSPVSWVIEKYTTTLGSYPYATLNATNLYYLLGANWVPLDQKLGPFTYGAVGTGLMIAFIVGLIALYVRQNDRSLLPFYCALMYIGLFLFGVKMHERYLFPAFVLLLYAYIEKRDWRILAVFIGFSTTFYLNCAQVLQNTHMPLGFDLWGALLSVLNLGLFGVALWTVLDERTLALPKVAEPPDREQLLRARLAVTTRPFPRMRAVDWTSMLALTLVYAAIAYIGLGSTVAPQTTWTSTGTEETVVFDLGEIDSFEMLYYGGINGRNHTFELSFSEDGEAWYESVPQQVATGDCFRWQYVTYPVYDMDGALTGWSDTPISRVGRYVRLDADGPGLTLMEIVFRDMQGDPLPIVAQWSEGARPENGSDPLALVDEPDTAPEMPSYYNGTFFDEIYHARTGYEHAHGMNTYEWTHPPLGKIFIMLGIKLFGMTPFGWRFMGALAGVLMVPAMFMLGKVLFGKTRYAFLAAFLMAFDMMHLTQTRIATIDSYAVLFIILMYTCMFRYLQMSFLRDGWRTLIPLGLSGLFMGLGCASKWTCMYAGVGLAVLFAWSMARHFRDWLAGRELGGEAADAVAEYPRYLVGTLCACLLVFIAVPAAIYYLSYIPHFAWEGGLTWERFWDTQQSIFRYHSTLTDDHAFQSPWYEWPLMLKPMFYFNGKPYVGEGMISTIMCMGNPAVWWVGLIALFYVGWRWLKPHLRVQAIADHRPAMLLLGFAAQYLPWVLVPRSMFIYHYFGSLPFVMMCIVYVYERIEKRWPRKARIGLIVYMAIVVLLFIGFYPLATGVQVPTVWGQTMNWLSFLRLPGWRTRGWLFF